MTFNALKLLDLQPQDRITTMTQAAYGHPSEETTLYVECADVLAGVVHTMSASGYRCTVLFADILNIEKCLDPVTLVVAEGIWAAHQCDPAYLGKPVRAIAAMLGERGQFRGLWIPKWPCSRPGQMLTLDVTASTLGLSESDILSVLPTNRCRRYHDPELARNRTKRVAKTRFQKFLEVATGGAVDARLPLDPSLKMRAGVLVSGNLRSGDWVLI